MNTIKTKNTFSSIVITQAIAIFGFVVVPVLITLMVPRTTIQLHRDNELISAGITRYTLLVVPFSETTIAPLLHAESDVTGEKYIKENRSRGQKAATQIATGSIELTGNSQQYQVQSTYEDAPRQAAQINAFIEDKAAETLALTAAASWKLTYLLGGMMTGFAALYCAGALIASTKFLLKFILPARGNS